MLLAKAYNIQTNQFVSLNEALNIGSETIFRKEGYALFQYLNAQQTGRDHSLEELKTGDIISGESKHIGKFYGVIFPGAEDYPVIITNGRKQEILTINCDFKDDLDILGHITDKNSETKLNSLDFFEDADHTPISAFLNFKHYTLQE